MIDLRKAFADGPSFHFVMPALCSGTTVLFGPSGSGKTTLLRMLAGLETPDSGVIALDTTPWFDSKRGVDLPTHERALGFVTQEWALFPHLTVAQNIGFGVDVAERDARVAEMLRLVRMEDLSRRYPTELSGGQKQRVALARAVARRPRFLFLDEPLSALDAAARSGLRHDLGQFLRAISLPTILVTHDRAEALSLGDEVALIGEGRVLQLGAIADVFSKPSSIEAARVVGVESVIPARVVSRSGDGLAMLDASGISLTAIDAGDGATEVFACIRADEVVIEAGSTPTSARNRLRAAIRSIHEEAALVRLDLDCGFPLAAYITKASLREMALREGAEVTAVIKAPAVHLVTRNARGAASQT